MAPVAPPADQASDLFQKLSLDSQAKAIEVPDATKKASIDSSNVANGVKSDRSVTPVLPDFVDPTMCHVQNAYPSSAFYYGGYDGSGNEWEDYTRYVNQDGVEGVYSYGYAPYSPYSPATTPVPTLGHDGQLYGAQHYQYPSPYFQSTAPTSAPYPAPAAPIKAEAATSAAADQMPVLVDSTNSKPSTIPSSGSAKGNNGAQTARGTNQSSSVNVNGPYGKGSLPGGISVSGYQEPRFGFDGLQSPIPWLEGPYFSVGQSRPVTNSTVTSIANGNGARAPNYRPHPMGLHHPSAMSGMYINRMFPNKLYGQYGNAYRYGMGYGFNGYDSRLNGHGWPTVNNKYRHKGRGNGSYNYGIETMDGLNELNRGPRTKSNKNQKGFTPISLAVNEHNPPSTGAIDFDVKKSIVTPDREQYNRTEFPETYSAAKFFIIKSYSEDDVHKSIKYNVWSSTPNGNKKLDAAYLEAQQKPENCPVFLFFSVNTSGQFIGVAEMIGSVDFDKNVEYWQQDKWIGCFPVKWHIVKDVPNSLLKHIILKNNENKPVTNSRDTQEVKIEQGLQLLKIFKDHSSKQCILDDFDFYEERQRRIQEKKAKQQQYQKHARVLEGKTAEDKKETTNSDVKSPEVVSDCLTVPVETEGDDGLGL